MRLSDVSNIKADMMIGEPVSIHVPLHTDSSGTIRVSGTRVPLDTVITCYHQGATPEAIHRSFDVLPINDIYAVIAWYLANRDEADSYLSRREAEGERLRQEIEAGYIPEQRAFNERVKALAVEKRRLRGE